VWAAIDVDTGELLAIKATWSRSSMDALLFLSRVLGARANKPAFVVEGGPWYSWARRGARMGPGRMSDPAFCSTTYFASSAIPDN